MPDFFGADSLFGQPVELGQRIPMAASQQASIDASPEMQDWLSTIGSGALHSVGYLGSSLGKLGRAVRGVLGGKPQELLAAIPFSDALGITNPANEVTGTQLLGGNEDTPFLSPTGIGGLAVDILTDPLTYLSFGSGALTKAGAAASKLNILPKTTAGRLAGFAAASPEAEMLARSLGTTAAEVAGQRLGGHIGAHIPFTGIGTTFDLSAPIARVRSIPGVNPVINAADATLDPFRRGAKALFQKDTRGFFDASGQAGAEAASEYSRNLLPNEMKNVADISQWAMSKAGWKPGMQFTDEMMDAWKGMSDQLVRAAEMMPSDWAAFAKEFPQKAAEYKAALAKMDPEMVSKAESLRKIYDARRAANLHAGYADVPLEDFVQYAPREASILSGAPESAAAATPGLRTPGQRARELTRGMFRDEVNAMMLNENLRSMEPEDAAREIASRYLGMTPTQMTLHDSLSQTAGRALDASGESRLSELLAKRLGGTITAADKAELAKLEALKAGAMSADNKAILAQLQGKLSQASELAGLQRSIAPEVIREAGGYFVNDPVADLMNYIQKSVSRESNAMGVHQALADMVVRGGSSQGFGLVNALSRVGLTGKEAPVRLAEAIARMTGTSLDEAMVTVKSLKISPDQLRVLTELATPSVAPQGAGPFLKAFDSITNLTKAYQTSWPQTLMRNVLSDIMNRWFTGGDALTPIPTGRALRQGQTIEGLAQRTPMFRNLTDAQAAQEMQKLFWAHGGRDMEKFAAMEAAGLGGGANIVQRGLPVVGAARPSLGTLLRETLPGAEDFANPLARESRLNPAAVRGVSNPLNPASEVLGESKFTPVAAAQATQNYLEEVNRLGTFANALEHGANPFGAMNAVQAAHYDYGNLSNFERNVMRRLVPFYSFSRQAIPTVVGEIATNPGGRMATTMKALLGATGQNRGFIPESVSSTGYAIPVGGPSEQGRQSYVTSLGLPFEDVGNLTSLSNMIGSMNPMIRLPAELAMGRQFFTNRDIPSDFPIQGMPTMNAIIGASPFSRIASTARQVANPNRGWGETAVQTLLGPRITSIDPAMAQREAIQSEAERILRTVPGARVFETVGINQQNLANLSPEQLALYRLYQLQNRRR